MTALGAQAWYVYAVLQEAAAVPGCAPVLPGASLSLLPSQDGALVALASLVPRGLFAADGLDSRAADPDWVAARAAAHHEVVAAASAQGGCVPLGFGTLFSSQESLRDWLGAHAAQLRAALRLCAGQDEWAVALVRDDAAHAAWISAHDPALVALAAQLAACGPGTRFLLQRRLANAVAAACAAHAAAQAAQLGRDFSALATAVRVETPRPGAAASWSLLLPAGDAARAALAACGAGLVDTGLALRVTGPWPAYAFARAALEEPAGAE